jgi:cold shock CspA family protein
MDKKQSATVMFYEKGWGFAEIDGTRTAVYLHHSDIIERKVLREGDRILCHVGPSGHPTNPFRAREIELLSAVAGAAAKAVQQ